MLPRILKWLLIALAALAVLVVILAVLPNWNWLRGPIANYASAKTGRTLQIGGDLKIDLGWRRIGVQVGDITFANPEWAEKDSMITVKNAAADVAVAPLFRLDLVLDGVRLNRAQIDLEKSPDGRKNWLLDREQRDAESRLVIRHLAIEDGRVDYRDPTKKTNLSAEVSTRTAEDAAPLRFRVQGQYLGLDLFASGTGDRVLALRDTDRPYRLNVTGGVGPTAVRANGSITNLVKPSALDLQIDLRGQSLAELYPVLGVVFPDTPRYRTAGRLVHTPGVWRYEKFAGRIGKSDIAGTLRVDVRGERPDLVADVRSTHLNLADLGPVVGAGPKTEGAGAGRVLPSEPFRTARWNRMDADVKLSAGSIARPEALPLHKLATRLQLQDGLLTLDPLRFDVAGGTLAGSIRLDGRASPIRAAADLKARKLKIAELFPKVELDDKASIGEVNGDIDLKGRGDSVAAMLGSADGHVALVAGSGYISKFIMEAAGLHLLEMLKLKLTGDEPIQLHCGIAAFDVKKGVMRPDVLVLDTDVVRIDGTRASTVNLDKETLDLTVVPKTKKFRLFALNTPLHVRGRFSDPELGLDKGALAVRGGAALALGIVNPVLALLPLTETGPEADSNCRRLIEEAKTPGRVDANGRR